MTRDFIDSLLSRQRLQRTISVARITWSRDDNQKVTSTNSGACVRACTFSTHARKINCFNFSNWRTTPFPPDKAHNLSINEFFFSLKTSDSQSKTLSASKQTQTSCVRNLIHSSNHLDEQLMSSSKQHLQLLSACKWFVIQQFVIRDWSSAAHGNRDQSLQARARAHSRVRLFEASSKSCYAGCGDKMCTRISNCCNDFHSIWWHTLKA